MSQHSVGNLEAKQLIGQVTYGPDILRVLFQAFDEAWNVLAPKCGENPLAIYAARLKLANAILGLARKDIQDPGAIRDGALKLLSGN
jgi:hypothetical protein